MVTTHKPTTLDKTQFSMTGWQVRRSDDGFRLFADGNYSQIDISAFTYLLFDRAMYEGLRREFPEFFTVVRDHGYYLEPLDQVLVLIEDAVSPVDERGSLMVGLEPPVAAGDELSGRSETIPWKTQCSPSVNGGSSEWMAEGPSTVCCGSGLIATKNIPAGTIYFNIHEQPHIVFRRATYDAVKKNYPSFARWIDHFAFYLPESGRLIFMLDYSRFMNHSTDPTGELDTEGLARTVRLVEKGEELFEDYTTYSKCPWATLYADMKFVS